jgi:hypothetical protein
MRFQIKCELFTPDQKLIAAKDIQGQKTIAVIIAVKETAFLISMQRIIGGIKVENQFLGNSIKRGDKLIDNHPSRNARAFFMPDEKP